MAVKMVPTVGVVVVRDGKRVRPTIGKAYEFTKEERDALLEAQPNSLRKPTNEDTGEDEAAPATATAEASQAKARGGRKAATANVADSEAGEGDTDPKTDGKPAPKGAGSDDDL
jgi:hypothetical protein